MKWLVWLKQFADKYLGGRDGSSNYDDILEFDPLTGQWKEVDRMIHARRRHAVSAVNYTMVAQYCNWAVSRYSSHNQYGLFEYIDLIIYLCCLCCSLDHYFIIYHDWPLHPAAEVETSLIVGACWYAHDKTLRNCGTKYTGILLTSWLCAGTWTLIIRIQWKCPHFIYFLLCIPP